MSTLTDTANVTAELIATHTAKFGIPAEPIAAPVETDHELIASDLRAENARLKASLAAVRLGTDTTPSDNRKPVVTAQRFRAEVGILSLRGMPREEKLRGIGLDPASVDDGHLERLFALGNDGQASAELWRASPLRYRQLKEAAEILGIYCRKPSSKK